MSIVPDHPISDAISWAQELQWLNLASANRAMGYYLLGCATLAMARTPQQALVALHETQADLLRHSSHTIAEAAKLWRK